MADKQQTQEDLAGMELHLHLRRLTAAEGPSDIVGAVGSYLASWTPERIRNLQKVDGGWGPFDRDQRLRSLRGVGAIAQLADSIQRHRKTLLAAGFQASPELIELDKYLGVAKQLVELVLAARVQTEQGQGYRHWSDDRLHEAA